MAGKLFNLLALSTLAVLAGSFQASPVNALATGDHHFGRGVSHAHGVLARKKRDSSSKRCKPRPSSSTAAPKISTSEKPAPSSTKASTPKASSAAAAPASAPPSPPPSSGSGKVGLAWPNADDPSLKFYKTSKTKFLYTWSPEFPSEAKSLGFTPIPMLWGDNQVSDFQRLVKPGYATYAMGMNEPNQQGQSDMSPEHGAELWKQYLEPLKSQGYTLISPATTSAPSGKTWMQDWLKACNGGCNPDKVGMHWYDISAKNFMDYVTDFHNTFQKPIWVTEMAYQNFNGPQQGSLAEITSFLSEVTAWMDSTPWVEAYFWFGAMHDMQNVNTANQLMASNGQPTDLGKLYINA